MKTKIVWGVLLVVLVAGAYLEVNRQAAEYRRYTYLLQHKCSLINHSGAPEDQIYECDIGQMRLRDIP